MVPPSVCGSPSKGSTRPQIWACPGPGVARWDQKWIRQLPAHNQKRRGPRRVPLSLLIADQNPRNIPQHFRKKICRLSDRRLLPARPGTFPWLASDRSIAPGCRAWHFMPSASSRVSGGFHSRAEERDPCVLGFQKQRPRRHQQQPTVNHTAAAHHPPHRAPQGPQPPSQHAGGYVQSSSAPARFLHFLDPSPSLPLEPSGFGLLPLQPPVPSDE